MAFKFVAFVAFLVAVNASPLPQSYDDHHHSGAVSYSSVSHGAPTHGHGYESHAPALQSYHAPAVHHAYAAHVEEEHHAPAHYQFEYSVHDPHTHDIKEQKEHREGDAVQGMYSLVEADGSKRVVEYTADKHNGFNAVVHREHTQHPVAAPVAKIALAPIAKVVAPVHHYAQHDSSHYYHH